LNSSRDQPPFQKTADADFQLSREERASIHPAYDADAVEQLLRWTRPEHRAEVLEPFQASSIAALGEKVAAGEITWTVDHPQVQEIIKNLRAPTRKPDNAGEQRRP
jgi:Mg/Co/Ni transporter MgtE